MLKLELSSIWETLNFSIIESAQSSYFSYIYVLPLILIIELTKFIFYCFEKQNIIQYTSYCNNEMK